MLSMIAGLIICLVRGAEPSNLVLYIMLMWIYMGTWLERGEKEQEETE